MRMGRWLIVISLGLACSEPSPKVEYAGSLRAMMREGDISAKIDLISLREMSHVYALGALEDLDGEVTIWDGQPTITQVRDTMIAVDRTLNHKATLLVYAQVPAWKRIAMPSDVRTVTHVEEFLSAQAKENQFTGAFPFLIRDTVDSLVGHVVRRADTRTPGESHALSGYPIHLDDTSVAILGFYSENHRGVFTHHDSSVHMHFVTVADSLAGHVDDLRLREGAVLYVPDE